MGDKFTEEEIKYLESQDDWYSKLALEGLLPRDDYFELMGIKSILVSLVRSAALGTGEEEAAG